MRSVLVRGVWAAALATLVNTPAPGAGSVERADVFARTGASHLALWYLDQHQPSPGRDPDGWMRWEKARVRILAEQARWRAIIERLAALPVDLPPAFDRWADLERAEAHIRLGEGDAALVLLRKHIWASRARVEPEVLARLRRLVVRAYLAQDRVEDARIAARRYQQDYRASDPAWNRLRARVLLRAGDAAGAAKLLRAADTDRADALYLLARLESGAQPAQAIYARAKGAAQDERSGDGRRALWAVAARAARRAGRRPEEIHALSEALRMPRQDPGGDAGAPLEVTGTDLWAAYLDYGRALGNQLRLLIGDDDGWYAAAGARLEKAPIQGQALLAVLTQAGRTGTRTLAHERFAQAVAAQDGGLAVVRALYLDAGPRAKLGDLPDGVRRRLADAALGAGDLPLASRLMGGLSQPPEAEEDPWFWRLRRARILILGGDAEAGIEALGALLAHDRPLARKRLDQLMQVLFDLQKIERHRAAIDLFNAVTPDPADPHYDQTRREIRYWVADSYKALGDYRQAARYYLESATLLDAEAMDPWAQTARYQAADALAQAGWVTDARRLYQALLQVTDDASRRMALRSKLQQLWLEDDGARQAGSQVE